VTAPDTKDNKTENTESCGIHLEELCSLFRPVVYYAYYWSPRQLLSTTVK